jgi:predicted branched-subunit amino acid permease
MEKMSDGQNAMFWVCFLLGLVVGIRHGGSVLLGVGYGVGISLTALFVAEMLSSFLSKNTAAFLIAAIAAFGAYKAANGPIVRSGTGVCVQTDRWGNKKCNRNGSGLQSSL